MPCVYIAPLKSKQAYKIGKSDDPSSRLITLGRFYDFDYDNIDILECETAKEAYKIEHILHEACSRSRICFEYDGGNEFFAFHTYDDILKLVNLLAQLNGFTLQKMPNIIDLKNVKIIKADEIDLLANTLTSKIKHKRLEYNITQQQLAKVAGLSTRTVRSLEAGNITITLNNFIKVLKALDLDYVLSEFEVETPLKQRAR